MGQMYSVICETGEQNPLRRCLLLFSDGCVVAYMFIEIGQNEPTLPGDLHTLRYATLPILPTLLVVSMASTMSFRTPIVSMGSLAGGRTYVL